MYYTYTFRKIVQRTVNCHSVKTWLSETHKNCFSSDELDWIEYESGCTWIWFNIWYCTVKAWPYFCMTVWQKASAMEFPTFSKHFNKSHNYSELTCLVISWNICRIRMSHWRHTMVDGAKFWISYQQLRLLRKASHWQLIQKGLGHKMAYRKKLGYFNQSMKLEF